MARPPARPIGRARQMMRHPDRWRRRFSRPARTPAGSAPLTRVRRRA